MSIEEDSYYPQVTINVDEGTYRKLLARVPHGRVRTYIEQLVIAAASGRCAQLEERIFARIEMEVQRVSQKQERIAALQDELRRVRGW